MPDLTVKLTGFAEFGRALAEAKALAPREVATAINGSLVEFGRAMARRMTRGLPVTATPLDGVSRRDGALVRSLHRVPARPTWSDLRGTVVLGGAAAPYALAQEFGAEFEKCWQKAEEENVRKTEMETP